MSTEAKETTVRHAMTRAEFRAFPARAFELAEKLGAVDIVDDEGRVRATLCGARSGDGTALTAAEKRCCDAAVALNAANESTHEENVMNDLQWCEAHAEACASGAELARLRGAT